MGGPITFPSSTFMAAGTGTSPGAPMSPGGISQTTVGGIAVTKFVALGDVHSKWRAVQQVFDHEFPGGNGVALSTGDFCKYPEINGNHRIHFVHGNHESFDAIRQLHSAKSEGKKTYNPLFAGEIVRIGGLNIAGIPGVHSPHLYDKADEAPLRYFTREAVETMLAMERTIDILLMHEAPFGVGFEKNGRDPGNPILTGIIEYLKPRLVIFGHHHKSFLGIHGETRIVGLDYPHRSYVVMEYDGRSDRLKLTKVSAKLEDGPGRGAKEYKYGWQSGIDEGNTEVLFDRRIPVGREQEIVTDLKDNHKANIHARITDIIRGKLPDIEQEALEFRAGFSLNTAIPFAAKYAAALEAEPEMGLEDRGRLMDRIYNDMTDGIMTGAVEDVLLAFQECLSALGLVWNRQDTASRPK